MKRLHRVHIRLLSGLTVSHPTPVPEPVLDQHGVWVQDDEGYERTLYPWHRIENVRMEYVALVPLAQDPGL